MNTTKQDNSTETVIRNNDNSKDMKVPCEVYSRIVGYLRPVQAWNEGKQAEFTDRITYQISGSDK